MALLCVDQKYSSNEQINLHVQVLLAKHKDDNKFYAVKVLQKKVILKKKEVNNTSFSYISLEESNQETINRHNIPLVDLLELERVTSS